MERVSPSGADIAPWLFFVWVLKWVAAVVGCLAGAVIVLLVAVAIVAEFRDAL